jgi:hypothetical protein
MEMFKKTNMQFNQLKRAFLSSGYEISLSQGRAIERRALDGVYFPKRHELGAIMGLLAPDEYKIYINRSLSLEDRAVTLLHELIHLKDETLPEQTVEDLGISLWSTMTDSQRGFLEFLVRA